MARRTTIENPTALSDYLDRMETVGGESTLRQAAVAGARVVHKEVRLRAPIGVKGYERKGAPHSPGTLKRSILIAYDRENSVEGKLATYLVTWSRDAFYGYFVEHGTSKMAAHPFLRPGFDAKRQEAVTEMIGVIQQKAKEAARG